MDNHLLSMFIVVSGAALIPLLARRLRIPSSALEIVYGAILFNFLIAHRPEWFSLLRELGFIYLMFIAGMELDLHEVNQSGRTFWYVLLSLLSFGFTPLIFFLLGLPLYLGIAVAMISAGIVIPVLREAGLSKNKFGKTAIGAALTGELLSILALTLIDAYHHHGISLAAGLELIRLALFFAAALLVLKLLYLFAWWFPEKVARIMESEDPVEEGIRAVVSVAFAGGLMAAAAGAEPILGSFLGGMIFSYVFKRRGRFEEKINALGFGFLIPFFFIGVGSDLDIAFLGSWSGIRMALLLTVMVSLSNLFTIPLARPLGLRPGEAGALAVLLSAPLSMIVVAGTLGMKMGLLSSELNGSLILTALLAGILYPTLFRPLARRFIANPI